MSESVVAQWNGHNYQARLFWHNAASLMDDGAAHVVEVTFEADAPKAFDDVVVRYDPPIPGSGPDRVPADYHQVKWHVTTGGRFGYEDLTRPDFIGATSFSLLQRLRDAKAKAPRGAQFTFVTVDRVFDDDPLRLLISGADRSVLAAKLFDRTKTDGSTMGKVRKCWREHLGLKDDAELREVLAGFRIFDGHRSLDEMRSEVNIRLKSVGMLACSTNSDFRYDELARQLRTRGIGSLTRDALRKLCADEGLLDDRRPTPDDHRLVAIRSFPGTSADLAAVPVADTLLLSDAFNDRYLNDGLDWGRDVEPRTSAFLRDKLAAHRKLRLLMDAHASVAFLAGTILGFKSGATVELLQKGRVGTHAWHPDDGKTGPALDVAREDIGSGSDLAVVVCLARDAAHDALAYVRARLPQVGRTLVLRPPGGPGQRSVAGGEHAAEMAEQAAEAARLENRGRLDAVTHLFVAGPNAFTFFLGQHRQGMGACVVYEWDFDGKGDRTYHPSFTID